MAKLDSLINLSVFGFVFYYFHTNGLVQLDGYLNLHSFTLLFLFMCVFADFANGTFLFFFKIYSLRNNQRKSNTKK